MTHAKIEMLAPEMQVADYECAVSFYQCAYGDYGMLDGRVADPDGNEISIGERRCCCDLRDRRVKAIKDAVISEVDLREIEENLRITHQQRVEKHQASLDILVELECRDWNFREDVFVTGRFVRALLQKCRSWTTEII